MGVWIATGLVAAVALGVGFVLWRRSEEKRWVKARPSTPPRGPSAPPPAAPTETLPPHRIVFAVDDDIPVVDVTRMRAASGPPAGDALDAPRLVERLGAVAREAVGLMELPGADRFRVHVRVEVARAMKAGILPLLMSRSPVAPITGEGVETFASDPAVLADLGIVAWETVCAERVRRTLVSLEGRLSVLAGGATHDAIAVIRARRSDLLELVRRVSTGEAYQGPGSSGRLEEVEASTRPRCEELLRQLARLPQGGEDAALVLRQVGGSLILMMALRAAAVEVRALLHENPDLALPKLVELDALLGRVGGVVAARRSPDVEDAVLELLAQAKEVESTLRASKERLFARELELQMEVPPGAAAPRVFLA